MKEERYNRLVELIGKEKADNVRDKVAEGEVIKDAMEKMNEDRDNKFLEIAIKKEDLENCAYYHGIRFRGHGIAQWDEKIGKFLILAYEFNQPNVERLEHFADVIEIKLDGFVPIEKIDKYKFYNIKNKALTPDEIEKEVDRLKK